MYSLRKFSIFSGIGQRSSNIVKLNVHRLNVRSVNISVKFPNISNTRNTFMQLVLVFRLLIY